MEFTELQYYSTNSRTLDSAVDADLRRIVSNYANAEDFQPGAQFSISDAISLAMLHQRNVLLSHRSPPDKGIVSGRLKHYLAALTAVSRALALERVEVFRDYIGTTTSHTRETFKPIQQLVRIRAKLIDLQDEWGGTLEGDIWGERKFGVQCLSQIADAKRGYLRIAEMALRNVRVLDRAISRIMEWEFDRKISFAVVQKEFGYPDVGEFWDRYWAP